jgi:hypothetical protein
MADEENPQEIQEPAPPPIPAVRMVIEDYNPEDAQHYAQWVASGRPDLPWQTTWYEDLAEDRETYVRRLQSESAPVTDVDIAKQYQQAYQAAQDIIFLLMSRVSTALVVGKHYTPETVNKEGARFTRYHKDEIEAFKLAGRHPDAGDALYNAVEASVGDFPWLKEEDNILGIFASTLPRNPK